MSIKIVYQGFNGNVTPAEAIGILARLFKGNQQKAEEVYHSPGYVLQSFESSSELDLVLPRLQRMGLLCEVVNDLPDDFSDFDDLEPPTTLVTCPACKHVQIPADACRQCGHSFIAKAPPPPPMEDMPAKALPSSREASGGFLAGGLGFLSMRNVIVVGVLAGLAVYGKDLFLMKEGSAAAEQSNPIAMLIKGIVTSDPKEVAKTMAYNPESGSNPYADRLKGLGIDQKEFSGSTGVKGGTIKAEDINQVIESNAMLKGAIEKATERSSQSSGDTETDQAIREATE